MIIHSPIISGSLTFADGSTFTLPDGGNYSGSFSGSLTGNVNGIDILDVKTDVDAILSGSSADKNSFSEIVTLINSIDTDNDAAFASHYTSSRARLSSLENETGSISSRVDDLELFSSSLSTDYNDLENVPSGIISSSEQLAADFLDTLGDNVVSSSAQIDLTQTTNYASGIKLKLDAENVFSSSAQVTITESQISDLVHYTDLDVKSKLDTEGVISGSSQLTGDLDSRYVNTNGDNAVTSSAQITLANTTGNLSSSRVVGDIQASSVEYSNILNKPTLFSGSAQVTITESQISDLVHYTDSDVKTKLNAEDVISGSSSEVKSFLSITSSDISDVEAFSQSGNYSGLRAQATTAGDVGLGNVTNESKSTMFTSPSFTGNPTAPTQTGTDDSTKLATTAFVQNRVDTIIGTAGSTLDTLGELSASLADDQGALSTLTQTVGTKLAKSSNLSDLTDAGTARTNLGVDVAGTDNSTNVTLVTTSHDYLSLSGQAITLGTIQNDDLANSSITINGSVISLGGSVTTPNDDTQLSNEQVQDIVGAMVAGNTESGITVTYQDTDGTLDFSVASQTDNNFTNTLKTKLDNIEANANVTDTTNVVASLTAGSNITIASDGTISSTDTNTNTQRSDEEIRDVAAGQWINGTNTTVVKDDANNTIKINATDTNTQLSTADVRGKFSAGTNVTIVDGVISSTDTNTQLSNEQVQDIVGGMLGGTETGITVTYQDTTGDIDFVVASQTDNNFTNTLKTKLDGIASNAEVNVVDSVAGKTGDVTLVKGDVGLGNVTNESKATMFSSAALTGNPTAPTQTGTNDSTRIATTAFVQGRIDDVIGNAGSTLDTLGELSASLADDSDALASLVTTVGGKLQKDQNLSDLTDASTARTNLGLGNVANTTITVNSTSVSDGTNTFSKYSLPLGTTSARGGFKVGYAESGKNYPVELSDEKMYVNVPWTDTNTTYTRASFINQDVNTNSAVTFGTVRVDNTTASTSKTTGALIVDGGAGITGALNVGGDVVAYASSDRRLKDNVQNIESPIEKVQKLNGVTWDWNSNADELQQSLPNVGVIAQEVEEVFPQLVHDRENGYKGVDYAKLTGLLIEAVKEQQKQIDELKSKLG